MDGAEEAAFTEFMLIQLHQTQAASLYIEPFVFNIADVKELMGKAEALLFHGIAESVLVARVPLLCVTAGRGIKTNSSRAAVGL